MEGELWDKGREEDELETRTMVSLEWDSRSGSNSFPYGSEAATLLLLALSLLGPLCS